MVKMKVGTNLYYGVSEHLVSAEIEECQGRVNVVISGLNACPRTWCDSVEEAKEFCRKRYGPQWTWSGASFVHEIR